MPRNFDELLQDDLSFVVRGQTFTMRYVRPEVLAEWEDMEEEENDTAAASVQRLDGRICAFLTPEDAERWKELRAREEDAIPFVQIRELVRWMVETQSHRPTETPSPSEPGRGGTARRSTVRPPSREATATA